MAKNPNTKTPAPAGRRQLSPVVTDDPVAKSTQAQIEGPVDAAQAAKAAKEEGEEVVTVNVPRPFRLTLDNHHEVRYDQIGAVLMPRSHAEHWYAQANGVTIVKK